MSSSLSSIRSTLIFGNGLGMALAPTTFKLVEVVRAAMKDPRYSMAEDRRKLIRFCMRADMEKSGGSFSEKHLETVQRFVSYCEEMLNIGGHDGWLNDDGRVFISCVHEFVFNVSKYLTLDCSRYADAYKSFSSSSEPFVCFIQQLCDYVRNTKSHVATLNYDSILYNNFLETHILSGYNGTLIDGFLNTGFVENNLERRYPKSLGYYFHLHGSPLYYERNKKILKYTRSELEQAQFSGPDDNAHGKHVILTHSAYKMPIIQASTVLKTYWTLLAECFAESEAILLIGCSGDDGHLNDLIRKVVSKQNVWVVEWEGSGYSTQRREFWSKSLGIGETSLRYVPLQSILDFRFR